MSGDENQGTPRLNSGASTAMRDLADWDSLLVAIIELYLLEKLKIDVVES